MGYNYHMNNIQVDQDTIRITNDRRYLANGREVVFEDVDVTKVIVITPDMG